MSKCHDQHQREGLVATCQGMPPPGEAHASVVSCSRPECIRAWKGYIRRIVGMDSQFYPDPQNLEPDDREP